MAKKKILESAIEQVTSLIESLKLDEHDKQPEGRKANDQSEEKIPIGRKPVTDWRRGKLEEVRRARTTSGTSDQHKPQEVKENVPEGRNVRRKPVTAWRRGKLEEVRRARTTSGTSDHHKPQEVKENVPEGRNVRKTTTNHLKVSDIKERNINVKSSRSPVKDIITTFENFQQRNDIINKTSDVIGNISQHGRVKQLAEHFIPTSKSSPENPTIRNSQVDGNVNKKKPKVIPEGGKVKPVPGRKVWTKLRSGLFGWKQPQRVNISSNTSHEKSQHQKIFTPMRPKDCAAKSVEENSEISKIRKFRKFKDSKIRKFGNCTP